MAGKGRKHPPPQQTQKVSTVQPGIRQTIQKLSSGAANSSKSTTETPQKRRRVQRSGSTPTPDPGSLSTESQSAPAGSAAALRGGDLDRSPLGGAGAAPGRPSEPIERDEGEDCSSRQDCGCGDRCANIMREELQKMREEIRSEVVRAVRDAVNALTARVEKLENHVRDRDMELDQVHRMTRDCSQQISPMYELVDDMAAETRRPTLIFSGEAIPAPVHQKDSQGRDLPEDVKPIVLDVVKRKLPDIDLKTEDIVHCFRVGRTRKVIVKFASYGINSTRDKIYEGRFTLMKDRREGDKLYVNESLSPGRQDILKALRDAKRARAVHSVFTRDGSVFFRPSENGAVIKADRWEKLHGYVPPNRER